MRVAEAWRASRLRRRFMSEAAVLNEERAEGRTPDATVDEVGAAGANVGFDGRPIRSRVENGYGTGDPNSPGLGRLGQHLARRSRSSVRAAGDEFTGRLRLSTASRVCRRQRTY